MTCAVESTFGVFETTFPAVISSLCHIFPQASLNGPSSMLRIEAR